MKQQKLHSLLKVGLPSIEEPMPRGDMPGDPILYSQDSLNKAAILFETLINKIDFDTQSKWVISISGGSGSGKTTLASVLAHYFNCAGIGTYILSGDNYPHRIPEYNDAERVHRYREAGQQALVEHGLYNDDVKNQLKDIYTNFKDGSLDYLQQDSWYATYHQAGKEALNHYLGTENELNFQAINRVLNAFKKNEERILLKRMGRSAEALWYDPVDFSKIEILFVEWTHGNHEQLESIDFRLFLNSTPAETLAYRLLRARDGQADSPFVTMVLEIEQGKLHQQSKRADLIFSKNGEVLSYEDYLKLMKGEVIND